MLWDGVETKEQVEKGTETGNRTTDPKLRVSESARKYDLRPRDK